ncbi:SDR family oxidoreductase [Antrihabitans sp. YC2-6]|uniref:SDR family oxidoreductase n=1 Tax=Antrihabitans sp. YC2-6 TaxID=2799498 RepID=UPI0018F4B3AD|nr:SDR family oxidoreductase [Antrihabitans sp. YC2-6]MBJ8348968.1 SDR family oxidoreductase [Antrihabitans sp. YC2-6]
MKNYIVTGGTGFIGQRVLRRLLEKDSEAVIHVLVRPQSRRKLEAIVSNWSGAERIIPLVGDLTEENLGIEGEVPAVRNIIHLGAIYDMTAGEDAAHAANVIGTERVIALAKQTGAMLHHVSSVAVAGDHRGTYSETDFDLGQRLPSPYHRTKFAAEKLVRETEGLQWRVYRPGVVVGDSQTGEMDKVDGPYYFFGAISRLAQLPSPMPIAYPNVGATNIVPVDYVAAALVELVQCDGPSEQTFHLVNPKPQSVHEIYAALASAAGAPSIVVPIPGARPPLERIGSLPGVRKARDFALDQLGIPSAVIDHIAFPATFRSTATRTALRGDRSIKVPEFGTYAGKLWQYWAAELDPNRLRRTAGPNGFRDRVVLITGASSGIGLASAHAVARRGATVLMVARGAEELDAAVDAIRAEGGDAHGYACDITDHEAVSVLVKTLLNDHGRVDYLVNNAGRSIRRAVVSSTDRMHDFERTMAVNYFGAVRLVLALLPSMRARGFGHIVNVSSIGVQTKAPLFSAYVASKSALDAFSTIAAAENVSAGITFTSIRMPLVRTPMIAPTAAYQSLPVDTPEDAAVRVLRALEDRPDRIDTPIGTLSDYMGLLAPSVKKLVLHQVYKAFPESSAAKDGSRSEKPKPSSSSNSIAAKVLSPLMAMPTPSLGLAKWVPGLYW